MTLLSEIDYGNDKEQEMKKIICALLILLTVTFTASAATEVALSFGASTNQFSLNLNANENNTSFEANVSLNAEADVILNRGNGFYVNLGLIEKNNIWIGAGYAYTTPVGNFDMMLTVGPHFFIQGNRTTFGADVKTMFMAYFSGVDGMYAAFGAKVNMDFVEFGNNTRGFFDMTLLIPELAIGYKF